jgi:hypothetical protein
MAEPMNVGVIGLGRMGMLHLMNSLARTTIGEDERGFAKVFPREGFAASGYLEGFQFRFLNAYRELSGDIIPPIVKKLKDS